MGLQIEAVFVGVLLTTALGLPTSATAASSVADEPDPVVSSGTISGVIVDAVSRERIANALVVLQCSCLQGSRETQSNAAGLYAFRELPFGTYTIQVLVGHADVSKVTSLPSGAKFRANFSLHPKREFQRMIRVSGSSSNETSYSMRGPSSDPPREPKGSSKTRLQEHRKESLLVREMFAPGGPVDAVATPGTPLALEQGAATKPISKDFARRILYSGTMSLAVFKLQATKATVEKLVTEAGGYVQLLKGESMILRIPAKDFRSVADAIGALGRMDEQSFEALDITEDYYDLKTRIEVLRRTQTQLMGLLDKSRNVAEALEVRAALDKVTLELESALGRQRVLASQVQFSALTLTLSTRSASVDTPSTNDPFPWVDDIGVEGTAWR